jgi:hypothetical protein
VATEFVAAAEATVLNLTLCKKDPVVPVAKTEYIKSVPVPALVPSDFTWADVVPILVFPTLGVRVKIGEVFAGISFLFYI